MRLLALLLALLLATGMVVAVAVTRDDGARPTGAVTLLGDSLNVGIEPYLERELEGWDIRAHNRVGRRTDEGLAELRALARLAPVLVVSLGTNDIQEDGEQFRRLVDEILRYAGPRRCVVWSTIWLGGPNERFNAILRDTARRHRNLELDDWAAAVAADPELLASDGVHGSPGGYAQRAERVARIVERCHPAAGATR